MFTEEHVGMSGIHRRRDVGGEGEAQVGGDVGGEIGI
jgi:hypothetical protein